MSRLSPLLAALALAGCVTGPDYARPDTAAPEAFVNPADARVLAEAVEADWWRTFDDPLLVSLVELAARENWDIAAAQARLREARALRQVAAGAFLPQVDLNAAWQRRRQSTEDPTFPDPVLGFSFVDAQTELYQVGFDAGWELDLFGRTRRQVEAAEARLAAVEAQRDDLLTTVAAEVARNYMELRGAQTRLALAERNLGLQRETRALVVDLVDTGLAPPLDAARARAQVAATEATLPPLRATLRAAAFRIAVLTGQPPAALLDELEAARPLPAMPPAVPIDLPYALITRRPDLRAAERDLAAASAEVGVATADFYPRLTIMGRAGTAGADLRDLFDASARTWAIGPSLVWPVFQGGRLRANLSAAEARFERAYARYRQAVLGVLEEVEGALVALAEERRAAQSLADAAAASREAVDQARARYESGLSRFLAVLDAQRTLTDIEDQLAARQTAARTSLVRLYKALGGGWHALGEPPA